MVRSRTSSVFERAVDEGVRQRLDGRLQEAVEVRVVEGLVDEVRDRRQGAVGLHPAYGVVQPRSQRVDLGVGAGAGLRELEGERLAADLEAAGGAVDAEQHEALGEAVDARRPAR